MKISNKLAAVMIFAGISVLSTGCETGTIGDNAPNVSANPITEKYKFTDDDNRYEITYSNPWRAFNDGNGYDITLIPGDNISAAAFKLSIKRDDMTDETNNISKARSYYSAMFDTGIIQPKEFKIGDITGLWLTSTSAEDMGINIEGITPKAQESSNSFELGIIINGDSVYLFKYEPAQDNLDEAAANDYRNYALSVLEGIKFK